MTEDQRERGKGGPPETYIKQVKDVLAHLYDFLYLQRHPLAKETGIASENNSETADQRLRRELIGAIEKLNPGRGVPFRTPHARPYNLLLLHYVEGMTVQEAARELGVSRRQAHRDLRRGEESVAAMLWTRRPAPSAERLHATELTSVRAEMDRLEAHPSPTDVSLLLQRAQEAVDQMASQRAVNLQLDIPQNPVLVSTNPVIARQVLVNTLSMVIGQAQSGIVHIALSAEKELVSIAVHYRPEPGAADIFATNRIVTQLARRLGWAVEQMDQQRGTRTVDLRMTIHYTTVLVIDDNEGLVALLEDYLTDHACRVIPALSGHEGLQLAQEMLPGAIILDVMMPEMDGWELLQRLRNHPQTASIPVVICSVINNPDLAYSLGASSFLPKPVSRTDVLNVLRQLNVV